MKNRKWMLALCIAALCFVAAGAAQASWLFQAEGPVVLPQNVQVPATEPDECLPKGTGECQFGVQRIRTDGYHEGVKYPIVKLIRSVEELKAYCEEYKDDYDLRRRENPAADSTIGFLDACDRYDDAYFAEQMLVMVLLENGSGSVRYKVPSVRTEDDKLIVRIDALVPEACTCDMAQWHILIEPEAGVAVSDAADVTVILESVYL